VKGVVFHRKIKLCESKNKQQKEESGSVAIGLTDGG